MQQVKLPGLDRGEYILSRYSLAVRIPQAIAKEARLNEGDCLALALDFDGSIVLRQHFVSRW
jgi:antitoxin component of MazEF toxin-antitoxin module